MLRMTSVDSGIEAECESNDCTDLSSPLCHSNSMSIVPFTSPKTDTPFELRCASNMAQPSTSSSSSGSETFPSIFEIEGGPQIMIVGYNDDRAPYKIFRGGVKKWRKRFCQLSPVGGGGGGHFPPAINTSIRSMYAPPTPNPNSAICQSRKMSCKCLKKYGQHRMAPYIDYARSRALLQNSFHQAASTNNSEKLLTMIFRGVDPNITDELNRTALHKAACKGFTDSVRVLLENGANPNLRDLVGNTALHLAACTNHIDVITLLLKHDCDASSTDFSGRSPLQLAQSKLKILAKSNHSASHDTLKKEILKVIDMLLLFIERKKSRRNRTASDARQASLQRNDQRSSDVPFLSSLCSDLAASNQASGVIRPASFTLDENAKLSFNNNNNNDNALSANNGTTSTTISLFSNPIGGTQNGCHGDDASVNNNNQDDLNADIELLNLFQTRMKLSENVEGDLTELMNNLDQLKIAIDSNKPKV
ncbi:hypothetical protein WDU94_006179 [Cyamophila willieti]